MQLKTLIGFIAKGFAKERACAAETKKEIANLREAIAAIEKKAGTNSKEVQSALDALESQIDYSPVVDTVAKEMEQSQEVSTPAETESIEDPSSVTPASVAESVVETLAEEFSDTPTETIDSAAVEELKETAAEDVPATV